MRILHVVTAFPRFPGDVITPWLVELLKRLRERGFEVEVFSSAYRGGGNDAFAGIPVHRFRYFPARFEDLTHDEAVAERLKRGWRYRLALPCYLLGGLLGIWRLCRRRRYDIVHVHWPMPHALFGWAARAACGARLVTTFYGAELSWVKRGMPWLRGFLARAARSSSRVVAISQYTAREIRELADVPVEVIPYGAAAAATAADAAGGGEAAKGVSPIGSAAVSAAPPAPAVQFTVLFVGRLVERKGVDVLLDAASRLAHRRDLRVLVVGDGPERTRLEALAVKLGLGDTVAFRGRVSPAALQEAYAAAQVSVLPAVADRRGDTEGLGVVLLEAMSHGVPVIGSDIGGIPDIITHGTTGLLVPAADAAALAGALERLALDAGLARRLGEAGRRRVQEQFTWEAIANRWGALYRDVA